jgi:orf78
MIKFGQTGKQGGNMDFNVFLDRCKGIVAEYTNEHLDKSDKKEIAVADVYVVWYCKTLKNAKALLSTTIPDGMYYEITYNGEKEELYLDAYKKFENRCIKMEV